MIPNWGLLLLGAVQIGTGLMVVTQKRALFGMAALPGTFSHYRYMLAALWPSIGATYGAGAFNQAIEPGAVLLGLLNVPMEIAGYWRGVRDGNVPKLHAALSSLVMGTAGLLCILFI